MRNNPAFINVLNYIDANNITEDQIRSASDNQILNIMYPETNGNRLDNHLIPSSVKKGLKHIYEDRYNETTKRNIKDKIEELIGKPIESIEILGNRKFTISIGVE